MIQSSSQRIWNTAFTQVFQCRLPIIQAPMAGVAGGQLASEISRAGGLGMIASGHFDDVDKLEREIDLYVESTMDSPSIGFIGFSSLSTPSKWNNYEHILNKYKPKAVQFFAPSIVEREGGKSNVQLAHAHGVKFIAQVGTIKEAKQVIEHNVDAIICQVSEAGGHGVHRDVGNSTIALASQISNMVDKSIPIIAAGGIVSGKQLASALCVCDGVSIGTRYWASRESLGNEKLQQELIKPNSCDDVVRTTVFDTIQNELSINKWPYPFNSVGALRNESSKEWDGRLDDLKFAIDNTKLLVSTSYCKNLQIQPLYPLSQVRALERSIV